MSASTASEDFINHLQKALLHLYDPAELRKSVLINLLGLENSQNHAMALQRVILDAIQALKPGKDVPIHSGAQRTYQILTYSYVEQSSQATVARNLALSIRQLRRQLRLAEQALADYLWERYEVEERVQGILPDVTPEREQELEWLKESFPVETAPLGEIIDTVLRIVDPLANASGIQIKKEIPQDLPLVHGQLIALRQALINVITATILAVPGGLLSIVAWADSQEMRLQVKASGLANVLNMNAAKIREHLQMAQQFIGIFSGSLDSPPLHENPQSFTTMFLLPLKEQIPVLVIDDNTDTLRLLQRYLDGTRYQFIGCREPERALALAEESGARIILIDILLPGIDGWELLGRLREHPHICKIPIIVCTISPEEELALSLGAAAFLRKPVNRDFLLKTLSRVQGL